MAFSRTAICWLPPARPGMCRCGIWPPGGPSARPSRPVPARGGACPAWRSARTAGSWPPPTRTALCGCGKCRFSPIRTPHSAPMLDRQQRQIGRITPRANRSPACADDTCAASGQSRSERGPGRFPDRFILEQDGSHPHVVHGSRTAGRNRAKDVIVQVSSARSGWSSTDRKRPGCTCATSGPSTQRSRAAASTTSRPSHRVAPRLPRRAAGPRRALLLLHPLLQRPHTRKALSLLGKGLDLRKLVAGAGFEPATSGL